MKEFKVIHKRSVVVTDGQPKLPTSAQTEYGEININYADGYETLSIRNNADEIVPFSSDDTIKTWISGATTKLFVHDLGEVDLEDYEDDANEAIANLCQEDGFYRLIADGFTYYVATQSVTENDTTWLQQMVWSTEEGPMVAYINGVTIEDGEVTNITSTYYMTYEDASSVFAGKYHAHWNSVSGSVTPFVYCDGNITTNNDGFIFYKDTTNNKTYIINYDYSIYSTNNGINYYQKIQPFDDASIYYQRVGTKPLGAQTITWDDWVAYTPNVVSSIVINESAVTISGGVADLGNYIPMEKEYTIAASLNELNDRVIELSGSTQKLDNLVTVVTSASTHEQYPSAKAVYDTFNEYVTIDDFDNKLGYQLTGENSGRTVSQLTDSIIDYINTNYNKKPVTIYETDGTTGFLGLNTTIDETTWQLTGLTLSAYSYVRCYFKQSDLAATNSSFCPSVIVDIPLSDATKSKGSGVCTMFVGGVSTLYPNNTNRTYHVFAAVDSTKTKVKVVSQLTLWDVSSSASNTDGKYLWKIEGYY